MSKLSDAGLMVVSINEYEMLTSRNHFLNCLEASGVDSWDGYSTAHERYKLETKADDIVIAVRGGIAPEEVIGQAG